MRESWHRINHPGIRSIYEVSTFGNIRSIDRNVPSKSGIRHIKQKPLKVSVNNDGYMVVSLVGTLKKRLSFCVHIIMKHVFFNGSKLLIDHKNRVRSDNRLINLRVVTHIQNNHNRKPDPRGSKYKGVSFNTKNKKWRVRLFYNGKYVLNKHFDSEILAANTYNEYAIKYCGDFAYLNNVK